MNLDRQSWTKRPASAAESPESIPWRRHHLISMGVAFAVVVALAVRFGPWLWSIVRDEAALEAMIAGLGWLGPAVLILLNALQIVIAPVPGYVMQIAAGYLYGPVWGGIWGSLGLLAGSMLAMWLARRFGRPLVTKLIGGARLTKWEHMTHSDRALPWQMLILTPTGDLPYFLAGLSHVRFSTIFVLTLLIRVPTTFVVAAAGSGMMLMNRWQMALAVGMLTLLLVIFLRYQERLTTWLDGRAAHYAPPRGITVDAPAPDTDLADAA